MEAPHHEAPEQTPAESRVYSPSVHGVRQRLASLPEVTSWEIVHAVLSAGHSEYGSGQGESVQKQSGPAKAEAKPVDLWFAEVDRILSPTKVKQLHGRLLIVALCRLDPTLSHYLSADGFLEAVQNEIREQPVDALFVDSKRVWPLPPDPTPLHLDDPTAADQLGRRGFARALALRLDRVWNEYSRSGANSSFVLHLHGPWGSGKTSLLKLLRREMQPDAPPSRAKSVSDSAADQETPDVHSRWIVVEFNAWQHQRLDPPWWPLLDAIYRQGTAQVRNRYSQRWHAYKICLFENAWRFLTGRRDLVTMLAVALLLLGILGLFVGVPGPATSNVSSYSSNAPLRTSLKILGEQAKAMETLLSVGSILLSGLLFVSRSLLAGSAHAAQAFVQSGFDPMERVCRHFQQLIASFDRPVIIFVDDLDRCQASSVVALLEGIQTLFKDPRAMYVVAADRRWLYACFENRYDKFLGTVREPGRALGSLFLEKTFQLSVSVPRLSQEWQESYLRFLSMGASQHDNEEFDRVEEELRAHFATAMTEQDVFAKLDEDVDDALRRQLRRQAAVERLASAPVEQSTSYFLQEFVSLMEPNPRSIKRLLHAYAVHRDLAILAGIDMMGDLTKRKQLVLWTIICLRWPALEEYLTECAGNRPRSVDPAVQALSANHAVKQVLNGEGVDTKLDLPTISLLAGLRSSESNAGAVA